MTCDEAQEELEAYALGALEPGERRRIAAHIAECSDCARIARAYQDAVDYLSLNVPLYRASPRVKDRVMGGVGAFGPPVYTRPRFRWIAAVAAVVLLAFAVGGVAWAAVMSSRVSHLRDDNAHLADLTQLDANQRAVLLRLEGDLSSVQSQQQQQSSTLDQQSQILGLALDPSIVATELAGTTLAPQSHCNYVWSGKQAIGALTCKDVPSTSTQLNYELWCVKGNTTLALASFAPRTDGSASMLVKFPTGVDGPVTDMWVTLEQQASQQTKPSTQVVLQKAVPAAEAGQAPPAGSAPPGSPPSGQAPKGP